MLAQGADPNVRFQNGQPALMRAVVAGAWNVFDAIAADRRTDVNAENPAGETPLMYLAIAGQTERRARSSRAAPRSTAWAGRRCTMPRPRASWRWRNCCCSTRPWSTRGPSGETPLMMAALSGSKPMVELLLKAGADVTTRDTKGQNAADWATTGKSTKLAAELRELIARQDRDKQARRAAAPAEAESVDDAALQAVAPAGAGQDAAPPSLAPPPVASPSPAPEPGTPAVRGVSGVKLNSYD